MKRKNKSSILILSFTDHRTDPRVYKQIEALNQDYKLITAGLCPGTDQHTEHITLQRVPNGFLGKIKTAIELKLGAYEKRYWGQYIVKNSEAKLKDRDFDVIISNDLETLPLAIKLAKKSKAAVYFDAHEYEPKVLEDQWYFRYFFAKYYHYLCQVYLPKVDYMTTVCNGLSDAYFDNYGVKSEVIFNVPAHIQTVMSIVDQSRIRVIHHGIVNRSRKIENMIHLVGKYLNSKFELDLMLLNTDSKYMEELKKTASLYSNIRFREPVPMPEIARKINEYDIGMFLLPKDNFNHYWALPNKFFEFIQARLAVAVWPSPEMKRIVEQEKIGIVSEDFSIESMAIALKGLTKEKIEEYKKNADVAAKKYNADVCADQIREIVKGLLS